jgi:hypothetical protein
MFAAYELNFNSCCSVMHKEDVSVPKDISATNVIRRVPADQRCRVASMANAFGTVKNQCNDTCTCRASARFDIAPIDVNASWDLRASSVASSAREAGRIGCRAPVAVNASS